ncbi:MAG: hypothetical protein QM520_04000 [Gammaproteobacteria bacterium]|nr:hypothetical protein [Gammaproteobacteria bacterium]
MNLNESIVKDAALEWFGDMSYSYLGAKALSQKKVAMSEAIWRLNPAIPE